MVYGKTGRKGSLHKHSTESDKKQIPLQNYEIKRNYPNRTNYLARFLGKKKRKLCFPCVYEYFLVILQQFMYSALKGLSEKTIEQRALRFSCPRFARNDRPSQSPFRYAQKISVNLVNFLTYNVKSQALSNTK